MTAALPAIYRADTPFAETEYVASQILCLVRSGQYRFRDITVAARNLEEYEAVIESVFARYGVPVYLSRRSDILEKPVIALIAGTMDAVTGGYEYEDMFRWLKTGLGGLTDRECDLLENYVIAWDIHGAQWVREEDWTANPDGWREGFTPEQRRPSLRSTPCAAGSRHPFRSWPRASGRRRVPPASCGCSGGFWTGWIWRASWRRAGLPWRSGESCSWRRNTASCGSFSAPSWISRGDPGGRTSGRRGVCPAVQAGADPVRRGHHPRVSGPGPGHGDHPPTTDTG